MIATSKFRLAFLNNTLFSSAKKRHFWPARVELHLQTRHLAILEAASIVRTAGRAGLIDVKDVNLWLMEHSQLTERAASHAQHTQYGELFSDFMSGDLEGFVDMEANPSDVMIFEPLIAALVSFSEEPYLAFQKWLRAPRNLKRISQAELEAASEASEFSFGAATILAGFLKTLNYINGVCEIVEVADSSLGYSLTRTQAWRLDLTGDRNKDALHYCADEVLSALRIELDQARVASIEFHELVESSIHRWNRASGLQSRHASAGA
jgi:hypothetical protein